MSDLYWQYAKEREGIEVIEHQWGFISYKVTDPESVYIQDIFIKPESRGKDKAWQLMNEVIAEVKPKGAKKLYGTCVPAAIGSTESMKVMFAGGFKLHAAIDDLIYLIKEL
jgi:GNAT superfamily N-acetyltransferase